MNDITSKLESMLLKQSEVTGRFIKQSIIDELCKHVNKEDYNVEMVDSYQNLVSWIMTELGHPVIKINVAKVHYENAIYSALQRFWQHHYDGSYVEFKAVTLTSSMIDKNEIPTQDGIESVLSIMAIPKGKSTDALLGSTLEWTEYSEMHSFNMRNIGSGGGSTYGSEYSFNDMPLASMLALELQMANLQHMFKKEIMFRFHRYEHRVKVLDSGLKALKPGSLIIIEQYKNVSVEKVPEILNDIWVKEYAKERVKLSWGTILKSINNVPLLGGATIEGDSLYDEAMTQIEKLEEELINKYEYPPMFYWG